MLCSGYWGVGKQQTTLYSMQCNSMGNIINTNLIVIIIHIGFTLLARYFLSNYLKWYDFKKCGNASAAHF